MELDFTSQGFKPIPHGGGDNAKLWVVIDKKRITRGINPVMAESKLINRILLVSKHFLLGHRIVLLR